MFSSKYGVARHIYINVPKAGSANHAVGADWTPAAGDVKVSKDGGAAANVTNLPVAVAMGNSALWDFHLTATEMQAAQLTITISDSATKVVDDTGFIIETYGHASAQHEFDIDQATPTVDVTKISGDSAPADNLELLLEDGPGYVHKGTAQSATAGTITLAATASTENDFFNDDLIFILSGLGAGQSRIITDYVGGATQQATVGRSWTITPDNTSGYMILPSGSALSEVNITQISGDAAAADNLEAALDGTGYNVGGGAIVVDSVTGNLVDLTTAMSDSIPADGTIPSLKQAIYMMVQLLLESSVTGTTATIRKADGSTTLFTCTINDATSPTSITRAT